MRCTKTDELAARFYIYYYIRDNKNAVNISLMVKKNISLFLFLSLFASLFVLDSTSLS